jgi:hypothetical protein
VVCLLGVSPEGSGAAFLLRPFCALGVGSSGASSFRLFRADRRGVWAGEGVTLASLRSDRMSEVPLEEASLRDPTERLGLWLGRYSDDQQGST